MSHKSVVSILVVGAVAILLLVSGLACGKSSSGEPSSISDITITSSSDAGHTHKVTVKGTDIDSPPTEKTIDTTYDSGHRHSITLTMQDYESLKDGVEVVVVSSLDGGHRHTFVITAQAITSSPGSGY